MAGKLFFTTNLYMGMFYETLEFTKVLSGKYHPGIEQICEIEDYYDQQEDYGFYEDDDANAVIHAIPLLEKLEETDHMTEEERSLCEKNLCRDFDNFMDCLWYGQSDLSRIVVPFIKAMVNVGLGKHVADSVEAYYKLHVEERDTEYLNTIFAYEDLYLQIGDQELFLEEDCDMAMRFYRLADLDWFHLRKKDREKLDQHYHVDEKRLARMGQWHDTLLVYEKIYRGLLILREERYIENEMERICNAIYRRLTRLWRNDEDHESIVKYSEDFLKEIRNLRNYHDLAPENCRGQFLMAHTIIEKGMVSALYCMSDEEEELEENFCKKVLRRILLSRTMRLQRIRTYVSSYQSDTEQTFSDVLLFARILVQTARIKKLLKVNDHLGEMAYYTSLDTFLLMLPTEDGDEDHCGRLSIMNVAYMNDPSEGKILDRFVYGSDENDRAEGQRMSVAYPYVFMKCFTSLVDDLPMWDMYGAGAKGLCLVVDWDATMEAKRAKEEIPLFRICYLKKKGNSYIFNKTDNPLIENVDRLQRELRYLKEIGRTVSKRAETKAMYRELAGELAYLFKDSNYKHEQELRILYQYERASGDIRRTSGQPPLLYVQPDMPICLKEIIVGPKFQKVSAWMPYLRQQIEKMCECNGMAAPRLSKSGIEYV